MPAAASFPSLALVLVSLLSLSGCGGAHRQAARPPARPSASVPAATTRPADRPPPVEGALQRRQLKIWGEVKVILKNKHAKLPELERQPTAGKEAPYATVLNDTPYRLTVWLAGPCTTKMQVPEGKEQSAQLCAGTYVMAAKVEEAAFLPLVREDQRFEPGMRYTLRIQIRRPPKTIRKRRWVSPAQP